jgi:tyrosyl-tRNA synthetase
MIINDIYADLQWRGLILQQSDPDGIRSMLATAPCVLYAGFDPTADSLHIGNLVPLIALERFRRCGHTPIALLGGGTGLIGDPSGKSTERRLNEKATVDLWVSRIRTQIERVLQVGHDAMMLDNYDWIGKLTAVELLRDIGKHFPVAWMLNKDSVRTRLSATEGISFTEFTYMVLQAYDFLTLHDRHGCVLQVGGSDQWGNMTAGIELIRRKRAANSYALTFPLITTASGAKFGKTEAGTIWLDESKTSAFAFYQYWLNTDDRDVITFLKYFTFMKKQDIEALEAQLLSSPEAREPQRALAADVTRMVHGEQRCTDAIRASEALYGKAELALLSEMMLHKVAESVSSVWYEQYEQIPSLVDVLIQTMLVKSKAEARDLISSGGAYVNNRRVTDHKHRFAPTDLLRSRFIALRKGRRAVAMVALGCR